MVHKTGIVKTNILRRHAEAGLLPTRKKCKFGDVDTAAAPIELDPDITSAQFIDSIITDATSAQTENDDEDNNLPETILPTIAPPTMQPTQSTTTRARRRQISLHDLFDYPVLNGDEAAVARFEFYWKADIKNLETEMATYDATVEEEATVETPDRAVEMADNTMS